MTTRLEPGTITIDHQKIEIARINPQGANKTTLVFLHEGLGSSAMWRDFPLKVSKLTGCPAFVFSRFGYGGSDPCQLPRPIHFMHDEGLKVLPQLLSKAGIDDYILIGHSDGGSIALIHAGGAPAQGLRGVVTEAAHVSCEPFNLESIKQAGENYIKTDLRRKLKKYHGENVDTAFWGWNDVWLHPDFIHWNIETFLPQIRVPVLAIQGEDDNYGTQAQIDAIAQQAGASAETLMLSDCGHAPHRDQENTVLTAMNTFIRRLLGQST